MVIHRVKHVTTTQQIRMYYIICQEMTAVIQIGLAIFAVKKFSFLGFAMTPGWTNCQFILTFSKTPLLKLVNYLQTQKITILSYYTLPSINSINLSETTFSLSPIAAKLSCFLLKTLLKTSEIPKEKDEVFYFKLHTEPTTNLLYAIPEVEFRAELTKNIL